MNWKKLLSIGALTMFSASIATGQGTAPTIVQGDYISNVFGNSNFIKNPNAKLNNKDVTVSNATVTRSTTTPLVATSEFLVTTSTATGSATWSTRTFDSGMKGQNCEARFSYRGFSVGSTTAQILQGANVVAQLTLTASTDPRIASINFPCGDLSSATTFRLQQATASLTGTNEIGGIYVGLATNMANVAQAEMVGTVTFSNGSAGKQGITSTWTEFDAGTWTPTVIGQGTGSNRLQIAFSYLPAGRYYVNAIINPVVYGGTTTNHGCRFGIQETTSGTVVAIKDNAATPANVYKTLFAPINGNFDFTTGAARTFRIVVNGDGYAQSASGNCFSEQTGDNAKVQLAVYRFPSSSELVVKPETQNVWAAIRWSNPAAAYFSVVNNTWTSGNSTLFGDSIATTYGKAVLSGANTSQIKIANMPVGYYRIKYNGSNYANSGGSATNVECRSRIIETSTATAVVQNGWFGTPSAAADNANSGLEGVFYNQSVGDRTFRFDIAMNYPTAGITSQRCGFFSSTNENGATATGALGTPWMIVQPLDQPSNSALYVEGPVKASATGAAIPSGYQHEGVTAVTSSLTNQSQGVWKTGTGLTLQPGVWLIRSHCTVGGTAPELITCGISKTANSAGIDDDLSHPTNTEFHDKSNTAWTIVGRTDGYFRITTATTFYPAININTPVSSTYNMTFVISAIRLN